jgi:uncharacterized protein with HEPN domain
MSERSDKVLMEDNFRVDLEIIWRIIQAHLMSVKEGLEQALHNL